MNKSFLTLISALFAGLIFGLGLILAGMANPAKVLAFLDLAGLWDPSLALVMVGALLVGFVAFAIAKKRTSSFLGVTICLPSTYQIDSRLVLGSLTFGVGWGLAGICPGPSIVLLGTGNLKGVAFFVAMLAGMTIFEFLENRAGSKLQTDDDTGY